MSIKTKCAMLQHFESKMDECVSGVQKPILATGISIPH